MKKYISGTIHMVSSFINKGQDRSVKAKKNIAADIALKGSSILISLLLVRLTLHYITDTQYGIWLTLSSIVGWFSFFDIGLTQGLRNKFAIAVANGNHALAKTYVSTTYAILIIIFSSLWILFLIVNRFIDWTALLNISESMHAEVSVLAIIIFTYFCLQFILNIITTVVTANQQPAKASMINLFGQIATLVFIVGLINTTKGSLINLGIALCLSPIVIFLFANIYLFKNKYSKYKPSIKSVKFSSGKEIFNLGVIFFIIQVAGIIQFQTANVIIARNFGTSDVTSYNIVFKYFGVLNMLFTIFLTPFWSASTEAYLKKDIQWIKSSIKKYNILNIVLIGVGIIMVIFSNQVYDLWLSKGKVSIPMSLSIWGFLFFNVSMFGGKYVSFLNGINALRIQFLSSILSPFLYIIISLLLIRYTNMGVSALFAASILANFNGLILAPLQYHFIINKNKKGIWIK